MFVCFFSYFPLECTSIDAVKQVRIDFRYALHSLHQPVDVMGNLSPETARQHTMFVYFSFDLATPFTDVAPGTRYSTRNNHLEWENSRARNRRQEWRLDSQCSAQTRTARHRGSSQDSSQRRREGSIGCRETGEYACVYSSIFWVQTA